MTYVTDRCRGDAFTAYVGIAFDDTPLDFVWFGPDDQAWTANDRELVCVVIEPDGSTTSGSVKGTAGSTAVTA